MNNSTEKMNNELTKRIMRRAYFIWALRMVLNPLFLKTLIVFVLIIRSTEYISYTNVFANAPQLTNIPQIFTFLRGAMMHTESVTLLLLLATLSLLVWLTVDFAHKRQHSYF